MVDQKILQNLETDTTHVLNSLHEMRCGQARVFAALFPGLGHLFLGMWGTALIYVLGTLYLTYQVRTTGNLWWLVLMSVLWVINIIHAHIAADR